MTVTWEDKLVVINFITVVERDIKAGRFGIPNFQRDGNMVSNCVCGAKFANVVQGQMGCRGRVHGVGDKMGAATTVG